MKPLLLALLLTSASAAYAEEPVPCADAQQLVALLDWAQETDEPMIFTPHYLHPQDASLVRYGADALDVSDKHEFQPDGASHRLLSAALELEPVFA